MPAGIQLRGWPILRPLIRDQVRNLPECCRRLNQGAGEERPRSLGLRSAAAIPSSMVMSSTTIFVEPAFAMLDFAAQHPADHSAGSIAIRKAIRAPHTDAASPSPSHSQKLASHCDQVKHGTGADPDVGLEAGELDATHGAAHGGLVGVYLHLHRGHSVSPYAVLTRSRVGLWKQSRESSRTQSTP